MRAARAIAWYAYEPVERGRKRCSHQFSIPEAGHITIFNEGTRHMGKGNHSQKNDKKKKKPKKQEAKSTNKK